MLRRSLALLSLFVVAAAPVHGAADKVQLAHKYAKDEKDAYRVEFSMDEESGAFVIKGEFAITIAQVGDKGADFELKITKLEGPMDATEPVTIKDRFDKNGMPASMDVNTEAILLTLFAIGNFLPGEEIEVGKGFDIDWKSGSDSITIKGKGTLDSIKPGDDGTFKVKYDITVTPGSADAGIVSSTSTFATKNGRLQRSEGTVQIDGQKATYKVTRLEPERKG